MAAAAQHDALPRVLRRHERGPHVWLGCGHGHVREAQQHVELGEQRHAVLHDRGVGGRHLDDLLGDLGLRRLVLFLHHLVVVRQAGELAVAEEDALLLGLQEAHVLAGLLVLADHLLVLARDAQHVAPLRGVLELELALVQPEDALHVLVVRLDLLVGLLLAHAQLAQ